MEENLEIEGRNLDLVELESDDVTNTGTKLDVEIRMLPAVQIFIFNPSRRVRIRQNEIIRRLGSGWIVIEEQATMTKIK